MRAMRTPASGKAQAAREISAPAPGVAPATGSRVKKATLALRSLAQSASQPSGIVMDHTRSVSLGDAEHYLVFRSPHRLSWACLSRIRCRNGVKECAGDAATPSAGIAKLAAFAIAQFGERFIIAG